VNANEREPAKLKEVMDKEKLNWRSFVTQETVKTKWNNPGTPMYYVIDPRGVTRYKWFGSPGEKAIDTAVETLIEKALTKGLPK
jgi:hypothetical protein